MKDGVGIVNLEGFAKRAQKEPGEIFRALLDSLVFGEVVSVLFDARRSECRVPDGIRDGGQWFNYSPLYSPGLVPDPQIEATNEGVSATLSIRGEVSRTYVPWSAVGMIQIPTVVGERLIARLNLDVKRARLRVVGADEVPDGDADVIGGSPFEHETTAPAFGGLRLVKGDA